jgi:hypothetical protein
VTRASLVPYAWVLGIVLLLVLGTATAVSMRFLRSVKRDLPSLHAELGRPGALYFVTLGWLTPSRFGIWLLTRPASFQALPGPLLQAAARLRGLLLVAFVLWVAAVALAIASGFL